MLRSLAVGGLSLAVVVAGAWAARRNHASEMGQLTAAGILAGPHAAAPAQAAAYARSMRALYDPLMGMYGDPLKQLGFVVCIDVPIRSYMSAGVSLPELLREAAKENPAWFKIASDNPPPSPFFVRRVRNYADLFQHHPALETSPSPLAGDLAFYGRWHIGLVTEVGPDGTYKVAEARGPLFPVTERSDAAMTRRWGEPSFFGRFRQSATRVSDP